MARYGFTEGKEYAARVHAAWQKPVENADLSLIRLEFEVFLLDAGKLSSTGKVACRDLVVGRRADLCGDTGALPYLAALAVQRPHEPASWLTLNERRPWVTIVFGLIDGRDERNSVARIFPFDASGMEIREYDYDLDLDWATVSEAADTLERSAATVRRIVARAEKEFGERLVRRTAGGHRRINLRLLRNLS